MIWWSFQEEEKKENKSKFEICECQKERGGKFFKKRLLQLQPAVVVGSFLKRCVPHIKTSEKICHHHSTDKNNSELPQGWMLIDK